MKTFSGHNIGGIFVIGILLLFSACKTSHILSGNHKAMSSKEILRNYYLQDSMPEWLSFRFNAELVRDDVSQSASVYVRMKQDSLIWISVRAMSLEGMRMVLTPDSLKMVDRLNSMYWQGDYRIIDRQFPGNLDFYAVQDILLVRMHDYSGSGFSELSACNDSLYYCLKKEAQGEMQYDSLISPFDPDFVSQKYLFYPENFGLASQIFTSDISQEQLEVNYGFSQQSDDVPYPEYIRFGIDGYNSGSLILETKSFFWGKSLKMPFKIPDKYQEISF